MWIQLKAFLFVCGSEIFNKKRETKMRKKSNQAIDRFYNITDYRIYVCNCISIMYKHKCSISFCDQMYHVWYAQAHWNMLDDHITVMPYAWKERKKNLKKNLQYVLCILRCQFTVIPMIYIYKML